MAVFYITLVFMIIPVTFGVSNIIAGLIADVLVSHDKHMYTFIYLEMLSHDRNAQVFM